MRVLVVAFVALVLAGCQVRISTDIEVGTDGDGTATVRIVADDELRDALAAADIDVRAGLEDAAAGASWSARRIDAEDATGVELTTRFDSPEQLGQRIEALSAGLTEDDGALLRDVELRVDEDGSYAFTASAGLDPPRILGSLPIPAAPTGVVEDGATPPPAFDGDALGDLLAANGDRFAVAELRVSLPTVPTAPGATVEATSATWQLPVDGLRTVSATAPPVPVATRTVLLAAAVAAGVLVGAFVVRAARRR